MKAMKGSAKPRTGRKMQNLSTHSSKRSLFHRHLSPMILRLFAAETLQSAPSTLTSRLLNTLQYTKVADRQCETQFTRLIRTMSLYQTLGPSAQYLLSLIHI